MNSPSAPLASTIALVLLGAACIPNVVESASDELGDSLVEGDGDDSSEADDESTTSSGSSTDEGSTDDDDDSTSSSTDSSSSSGTDSSSSSTSDDEGEPHACGWSWLEIWYACGFEGPDPIDEFPMDCDEYDFPMQPGVPCPPKLGLEGCCDAQGDLWWCERGFVQFESCAGA